MNRTISVEKPERLDAFLRREIPVLLSQDQVSNSKIRRLVMAGKIFVNGRQCRVPAFELRPGARVSIELDEEKFNYEKQPDDIDYVLTEKDVLFEDEDLIIVNKPAFLPTEETMVKDRKNLHQCVVDYLWSKNSGLRNPPYAGIMHRLDRETSGAILFTKTRQVNKAISEIFQGRELKKIYTAKVTAKKNPADAKGFPKEFSVDNYIGRISSKSSRCTIGVLPESKGGQRAWTDFELIKAEGKFAWYRCILHTGRTHQIRVHLSLSGMPIEGDVLYGGIQSDRIKLHSTVLEFIHPVTGKIISINCNPEF